MYGPAPNMMIFLVCVFQGLNFETFFRAKDAGICLGFRVVNFLGFRVEDGIGEVDVRSRTAERERERKKKTDRQT
jgi:hypothetical protein